MLGKEPIDESNRPVPPDEHAAAASYSGKGSVSTSGYDHPTVQIALAALLVLLTSIFLALVFLIVRAKARQRHGELVIITQQQEERQQRRGGGGGGITREEGVIGGIQLRQQDEQEQPPIALDKERLKRRYETIETWLISKKVQKHDELCDKILHRYCRNEEACSAAPSSDDDNDDPEMGMMPRDCDASDCCSCNCSNSSSSSVASSANSNNNKTECPVCMAYFHVGDIVSWSPNDKCRHVFHHECIKQWLIHKSDCPCCREAFLSVDRFQSAGREVQDKNQMKTLLRGLRNDHFRRNALTYVCVKDGFVEIPTNNGPPTARTRTELREMEAKIGRGIATKEEKIQLRGVNKGNHNSSNSSKGDVNSCCSMSLAEPASPTAIPNQQQQSVVVDLAYATIDDDDDDDDDRHHGQPQQSAIIAGSSPGGHTTTTTTTTNRGEHEDE